MKLTQEQLAALIAQVFANLIAAGKDPSAISDAGCRYLHPTQSQQRHSQ